MKSEQLKKLIQDRPFRPFRIDLVNERSIPVRHPDYIWLQPDGRTCWVYQDDGASTLIDVPLIQSIFVEPPEQDAA